MFEKVLQLKKIKKSRKKTWKIKLKNIYKRRGEWR